VPPGSCCGSGGGKGRLRTQVAINGVHELAIMKQTRHKSAAMLRRYVRDASMFRDNATARAEL
jgi:hypothetical protein